MQNNKDSKIALLCIYLSLLAFIITFLSGVGNSSTQNNAQVQVNSQTNVIPGSDEHVEPDQGSCSAVAALLQFFLLATFMWNSVYGTQLVLLVRTLRRSLPPHWTKLSLAVGWGTRFKFKSLGRELQFCSARQLVGKRIWGLFSCVFLL